PQSREIGMRTRHFDRETERYGRRHSVFLNYFDLYPLRTMPDYASMQCRSGTFGKSRKLVLQLRDELVGNVSRYSDHYIRPRVGGTYEVLHIVERYRFDSGNRAEHGVAVRSSRKNILLQALFAEFLFVVVSEVLFQGVQLILFQPLEILFAQSRFEQLLEGDVGKEFDIVAMNDSGKRRHLFIDLIAETRRNGEECFIDLVYAQIFASRLRDHSRRKRGQALFARRIVGRAYREEKLDVELRKRRFLNCEIDLRFAVLRARQFILEDFQRRRFGDRFGHRLFRERGQHETVV